MPLKHITSKNSVSRPPAIPAIKKRLIHKKDLFKIAGCLSSQDAAELKTVIEQGCERIEQDAWKNLY
jgi:hypothetical protein